MKKVSNLILFIAMFIVIGNLNVYAATVGQELKQPEDGWRRYDDSDNKIIYSDDLTRTDGHLQYRYNNTSSAAGEISFTFYGTKLRIIGINWNGNNISNVKIKIDDLNVESFNQNIGTVNQCINYEKTDLPLGNHTVTITHDERAFLDAIDIDEDGYLLSTTSAVLDIETVDSTVKVGQEFSTDVVLSNVNNIYAEDFTISYDKNLFEYIGYEQVEGLKVVREINNEGVLRFITASEGKDNAINDSKTIVKLKFRAIKAGEGKVDATKARIANIDIEWDLEELDCREVVITVEGLLDVNRSDEFTLVDLAIDAYYYNELAANTDTVKYDCDVVLDGMINDEDLLAIVNEMLLNSNYGPNN